MAQASPLNLSVLDEGVEYPLNPNMSDKNCLIHVKLTESCAKAIDGLIASNRGAFFSLWFTQNGGYLTIPSAGDGMHKFQFSTARLNKVDTHGKLECLHQALVDKKSRMSCMGLVEHKLSIKATDEVYEATKKRATELEKERQGVRAKEIKIPKVANKSKIVSSSNSTAASRPSPVIKPPSVIANKPSLSETALAKHSAVLSRTQRTLRERVMYLLALKSIRRPEIVSKLKKATKRGESSLTNLDSVLSEVADLHDGSVYHLKSSLYSELDVDTWPFYGEAERGMVKRKLLTIIRQPTASTNSISSTITTTTTSAVTSAIVTGVKRPHEDQQASMNQFISKKSKMSSLPSTAAQDFTSSSSITVTSSADQSLAVPTVDTDTAVTDSQQLQSTDYQVIESEGGGVTAPKHKKKKKHKHSHSSHEHTSTVHSTTVSSDNPLAHTATAAAATVAGSSADNPLLVDKPNASTFGSHTEFDFSSQFPPVTNLEERNKYKQFFNEKYDEYLSLKKSVDTVHSEVLQLSDELESLPKNSPKIKEMKARIKEKFLQMQQDASYQKQKSLLLNLHYKLEHLKKMVVQYDSSHY